MGYGFQSTCRNKKPVDGPRKSDVRPAGGAEKRVTFIHLLSLKRPVAKKMPGSARVKDRLVNSEEKRGSTKWQLLRAPPSPESSLCTITIAFLPSLSRRSPRHTSVCSREWTRISIILSVPFPCARINAGFVRHVIKMENSNRSAEAGRRRRGARGAALEAALPASDGSSREFPVFICFPTVLMATHKAFSFSLPKHRLFLNGRCRNWFVLIEFCKIMIDWCCRRRDGGSALGIDTNLFFLIIFGQIYSFDLNPRK